MSIIDNQNGIAFEVCMQHNAAFFCCQVNIKGLCFPKKHGDAQYIWQNCLSTAFLNPFYLNGVLVWFFINLSDLLKNKWISEAVS